MLPCAHFTLFLATAVALRRLFRKICTYDTMFKPDWSIHHCAFKRFSGLLSVCQNANSKWLNPDSWNDSQAIHQMKSFVPFLLSFKAVNSNHILTVWWNLYNAPYDSLWQAQTFTCIIQTWPPESTLTIRPLVRWNYFRKANHGERQLAQYCSLMQWFLRICLHSAWLPTNTDFVSRDQCNQ